MQTQRTPGPYWVRTNTNGTHDVCGRHGKTVRSYRADQVALADADCRRLQAGFTKSEKAIRDAAPDLLAALEGAIRQARDSMGADDRAAFDRRERGPEWMFTAVDSIAKATGADA